MPTDSLFRRALPYALFAVALAAVHWLVVFTSVPAVLNGQLIDTDTHTWLVRVRELAGTGSWYDATIARSNWPFGEVSHWTRPLDAVLLAGAWILTPLLGFERALFWSAALSGPVLNLATCLALVWATAPLLERSLRLILMIAVLAQPGVISYSLAGRADHHGLILLVFVLMLGCAVRALGNEEWPRAATLTGIFAAIGLWISTEFLLPIGMVLGAGAVCWLLGRSDAAARNLQISLGLLIGVVAALLLERPWNDLTPVEYDRLSLVHVAVAAIALGFWTVLVRVERRWSLAGVGRRFERFAVAAAGGIGALTLMWGLFPPFFAGPWVGVDPRVMELWLSRVTELEPLWPEDGWEVGRMIAYLGPGLLAPPYALWVLRREWGRVRWGAWLVPSIGVFLFAAMALYRLRFSTFAELLGAIFLVHALGQLYGPVARLRSPLLQAGVRVVATAGALAGFMFLGGAVMAVSDDRGRAAPDDASCSVTPMAEYLGRTFADRPRTVVGLMDLGPEILYRTHHRVIASPYHRNREGLLDSHRMLATADLDESASLMRGREVDLVLLCEARDSGYFRTQADEGSVYDRLIAGDPPAGLTPLILPADLHESGFRLFQRSPGR